MRTAGGVGCFKLVYSEVQGFLCSGFRIGDWKTGSKKKLKPNQEGRYKATWKKEFELPWREAGPVHLIITMMKVDSDQ